MSDEREEISTGLWMKKGKTVSFYAGQLTPDDLLRIVALSKDFTENVDVTIWKTWEKRSENSPDLRLQIREGWKKGSGGARIDEDSVPF